MCAFRPIRPKARRDRRFGEHLHQYYAEVVAAIHDANSILILGPGEAKGELEKRLGRRCAIAARNATRIGNDGWRNAARLQKWAKWRA